MGMVSMTLILAIESSCDETAVAVVSSDKEVLSHIVLSQLDAHRPYGGVVPEIAARSHITHMDRLVAQAMEEAGVTYADLDAVAATAGPGLIGGVIVGVMTAKAIASTAGKPFIAVNHLEGHALTVRLTEEVDFPFLLLLVSGGHCQFIDVQGIGAYRLLGGTIDDALGEAFDKVAKMMGLPYPGGPIIERLAKEGDVERFDFPKPILNQKNCDFSFSGLKTAVKQTVDRLGVLCDQDIADVAASFQRTAGDILVDRIGYAMDAYGGERRFVLAGGVAANQYLRGRIEVVLAERDFSFHVPPVKLCTDNAAMIAWAAMERFTLGLLDGLDVVPRARWQLSESQVQSLAFREER